MERTRGQQADGLLADLREWQDEDLCDQFDRAFRQRKEAKRLAKAMKNGAQGDGKSDDRESGDENKEIEQKFLVRAEAIAGQSGVEYRQGYLAATPKCSIRVRIVNGDAHLTIKSNNDGVSRSEWEYPIPAEDAEVLLGLSLWPVIEKTRYEVTIGPRKWEIDEFHGMNEGLVVGEVELERESEEVEQPPWVVKEVSSDPRFYNVNLARHPYRTWAEDA